LSFNVPEKYKINLCTFAKSGYRGHQQDLHQLHAGLYETILWSLPSNFSFNS